MVDADMGQTDDITATEPPAVRTEPNPKWIRGRIGATTVVDSRATRFVWEFPYYPQWYVPRGDVTGELRTSDRTSTADGLGTGTHLDLVLADGTVIEDAAKSWDHPELAGLVRFRWDALDRWFEEEVEVFVHPRSPYTRVDVLPSTRHVVVRVDGVIVAESRRASILYETGLPPRYYLPPEDVRTELLTPTTTSTGCPYKGVARYWSVTVEGTIHDDLVWGYDEPLPESADVAGLLCFYNERVELTVDGSPAS
ncbi:MAG: DUF427 domain-containing protein [Actinomycetota bacterium]